MLAVTGAGCGKEPAETSTASERTALSVLNGVPQDGLTLGQPSAASALTLYVTPVDFNNLPVLSGALRPIVDRYVRTGRLKLRLRPVVPTGITQGVNVDQARQTAATLEAAARQDKMWHLFVTLNLRFIGDITADDVRAATRAVPGLDDETLDADKRSAVIRAVLTNNARSASTREVGSPPAYFLKRGRQPSQPVPDGGPAELLRFLEASLK